ncbi:hypothetical protein DACRYDRAFT_115565 [Dacryopinax primogenitus]|uniref:Uncharacterized protein n=1 Tax=Dacryopinax primogenitus (strain DJM 731) TaxID=1858805 RepID=M5FZE2_DACPD|nr:uncharacterized protein DACRYDRAFT_115565 [Dacryopinax primogenitus]EJU03411.1 hypothetical protein DACRYDRAFT_115565 [Dacryopinax primogenitus]
MALPPVGEYAFAYDIGTRALEDDPPNGYGLYRSSIYLQIRRAATALGYRREQYSIWQAVKPAAVVYAEFVNLLSQVQPAGVLPACLRRAEILHIPDQVKMILNQQMRLSGIYSPWCAGPTPAALVPPGMGGPFPPVPLPGVVLPAMPNMQPIAPWPNQGRQDTLFQGMRPSQGTWNTANYRA